MNSRHLFLSTMAILVGLSVYGFVNRSPEAVEGMIAEAEGRPVWNERSYKQAMAEIEEAIDRKSVV